MAARLLAALAGLVLTVAPSAQAASLNVQSFHPSAFAKDFLSVNSAGIANPGFLTAGLSFHYTANPMGFEGTDAFGRSAVEETVTSRIMTELLVSYAPLEFMDIGLALPFVLTGDGKAAGSGLSNIGDPSGFAMGEMRLAIRFGILREGVFRFGAQAEGTLPTGDEDKLAGGGPGGGVRIMADVVAGGFRASLNIGAHFRGEAEFLLAGTDDVLLTVGHEMTIALGGSYDLIDELALIGEMYTRTQLAAFFDETSTQLEALGGVRVYPVDTLALTLGAGGGTPIIAGAGTSQFRVAFDLRWAPKKPVTLDSDEDGFEDADDECPLLPEDKDGFEDQDGCPDPDNDGDGVLDADDKCPNEPEDRDGRDDEDGCPDGDDDGDGIPDTRDKCPADKEDIDGFEDEDGCPDPDNDQDTIPDGQDKCPDSKETINDFEDDDGCPDFPGVSVTGEQIVLATPVEFRPKKTDLRSKHFDDLRNLARLIVANPAWTTIEIVAHTDPKSAKTPEDRVRLTTERAQAIQQFLITEGVNFKRLTIRGAGDAEPVADNKNRKGRAANNRVQFLIKK